MNESNTKLLITVVIAFLFIIQVSSVAFVGDAGFLTYSLIPICAVLRYFLYPSVNFRKNFIKSLVISYFEVSLCLSLPVEIYFRRSDTTSELLTHVIVINAIMLTLGVIAFKCMKVKEVCKLQKKVDSKLLNILSIGVFLGSFLLSVICFKLKVGVMGMPAPELPYKLEAALNLLRTIVVPSFYVFAIYHFVNLSKSKNAVFLLVAYLLWAVTETYTRGSRGVIFLSMLPIMFLVVKLLKPQKVFIFLSGFVFISLLGFVGGNYLRHCYHGKCQMLSIKSDNIYRLYSRLFSDVRLTANILKEMKSRPELGTSSYYFKNGGGVKINTHIVDRVPVTQIHSSGITALTDGLLIGSKIGSILTLFFVFICAGLSDIFLSRKESLQYVFPLLGWYFIDRLFLGEGLWSFFMFRSIFTISVFPLSLLSLYFIQKFLLSTKGRETYEH